jgi:hypothetical protein
MLEYTNEEFTQKVIEYIKDRRKRKLQPTFLTPKNKLNGHFKTK